MDEAEADRAGEREHVALAELGELARDDARLEELLELDAELGVDDRQEEAPGGEAEDDGREPQPLGTERVDEQRAVHRRGPPLAAAVSSARSSSRPRRTIGAPSPAWEPPSLGRSGARPSSSA